ncbi:MAG: hypothetical protein JWM78_1505 [Verrucomicrobiaceae bacterium]|nr:hypothetical protein [Verrucomicrobiaceae bacterium]
MRKQPSLNLPARSSRNAIALTSTELRSPADKTSSPNLLGLLCITIILTIAAVNVAKVVANAARGASPYKAQAGAAKWFIHRDSHNGSSIDSFTATVNANHHSDISPAALIMKGKGIDQITLKY